MRASSRSPARRSPRTAARPSKPASRCISSSRSIRSTWRACSAAFKTPPRACGLQQRIGEKLPKREAHMPVKPNGNICRIREQIIEDQATGLILPFECENDKTRLVIAGRSLPFGNREILFDGDGREAAAGTLLTEVRRPSLL